MLIESFCSFVGTGPGPDSLKRGEWGPSGWGSFWAGVMEPCLRRFSGQGMAVSPGAR